MGVGGSVKTLKGELEVTTRLITVNDVAKMLAVKPETLYQWAEMRQIPHLKINGCLRFDIRYIEPWIGGCKNEAVSGYNPVSRLEARKGGQIRK
jgi:predicted DNA-binding transcriptional regulator AlpA